MEVKMLETRKGCDDDNANLVKTFFKDKTYDIGSDLGGVFVKERWAKEVKPKPKPSEQDDKKTPDENKDQRGPAENK